MIPHVTQFDEADITEMEAFRKKLGEENKEVKVTPLVFLIKAVVAALKKYPNFNASLDGDNLVLKKYFHVGIAVDTPDGLVVPVIRDADRKGLLELAQELAEISVQRARKEARARGHAGRLLLDFLARRHRRHRLHADHQRTGSGDPGRVAFGAEAGVERQRIRATADAAAVAQLRPSRHRRRGGGALHRLPRPGARRPAAVAAVSVAVELRVPDLGGSTEVAVIELLAQPGEHVGKDQGLLTLESDKATMEVPAPAAGVLKEWKIKVGDSVAEGQLIALLEAEQGAETPAAPVPAPAAAPAAPTAAAPAAAPAALAVPSTAMPSDGKAADIECQLLVLGSGPGGYTAAFRAADLGMDVVLVERYPALGGVCLNVGCIPSKALLHAAELIEEAKHAVDFGLDFGTPKIDLDKLRAHKDKVVRTMSGGLAIMAKQRKVRVLAGSGRFVSANELEVAGDEGSKRLRFGQCIIAAGSQAVKLPGLPWDDARMMDSTDALLLADTPRELLVVGGGIIGLEMACVYSALGSKVTVVEFMDQLMPGADADLVRPLAAMLKKRGVAVHLKTKVAGIEAKKDGLHADFEGENIPATTRYDRVLVAVGRTPNGKAIDAQKAGVDVSERGFIAVDRQMRTNVPHIYAIGDIVGQPMLAHKATHEGKLAAEVAAGHKREWVARVIPSVAYTDPEVAWVGLTETDAKKAGVAVGTAKFPWAASGRAVGLGRSEGFTKLVFDTTTHRVVGGGIVGVRAGDLIAEIALAIEMGCEAGDLGHTIHPHPTLSESVGMAAEVFEGSITDLYIPRRQ